MEKLSALRSTFNLSKAEDEIASLSAELQHVHTDQAVLSNAMKELNMQASLRSRVNMKREEKATKVEAHNAK